MLFKRRGYPFERHAMHGLCLPHLFWGSWARARGRFWGVYVCALCVAALCLVFSLRAASQRWVRFVVLDWRWPDCRPPPAPLARPALVPPEFMTCRCSWCVCAACRLFRGLQVAMCLWRHAPPLAFSGSVGPWGGGVQCTQSSSTCTCLFFKP